MYTENDTRKRRQLVEITQEYKISRLIAGVGGVVQSSRFRILAYFIGQRAQIMA